MKNIIFLDNSNIEFSGNDLNTTKVRGTESSMILLSEELVKKGFKVTVANAINIPINVNGVEYTNKKILDLNHIYDVAIASSNANLFNGINAKKKIVWSNSVQRFEKFLRQGQLIPFLKHKPIVVTMCDYQYKLRSFITSFYGKDMISLTVDPKFYNEPIDVNYVPPKKALYNIRSNRNLDWLLNIWTNKIFPKDNSAELYITPGLVDYTDVLKKSNIKLRSFGTRKELMEELKKTRVFTYIGHKSDIWTLTVEEARQLCVPVVTYGIGSISDRVDHGNSGYVVKSDEEFADTVINLMNDKNLYLKLKKNMFQNRGKLNWTSIAEEWIKKHL